MKVAVLGDTHIGAVFGLGKPIDGGSNTRIKDYEKTMDYAIQYCIDNNVDVFIQTGDLFEKRNPTPTEIEAVDVAIRKLSSSNIATFIIMGNHDYKRFGGTYTSSLLSMPAKHYPNVRILIKPEVVSVSNERYERINLALMPYRDKRMYSGKSTKECSIAFEEEVKGMYKSANNKYQTIFVGHNFYFESSYNDFGGSEILARPSCFEDFDASFMGHYHNFKEINKNSNCFYTGSMERNNFGEAKQDKFMLIYDTSNFGVEKVKLPVKDLQEITVDITESDLSNVSVILDKALTDLEVEGKIVRMKIAIDESMGSLITKGKMEKRLYSLGADYVSKIIVEKKYTKMSRDTSALKEDSDFKMFSKFLESQRINDETRKKIIKIAKDIVR